MVKSRFFTFLRAYGWECNEGDFHDANAKLANGVRCPYARRKGRFSCDIRSLDREKLPVKLFMLCILLLGISLKGGTCSLFTTFLRRSEES